MSWAGDIAEKGPLGISEALKGFAGIATLGALTLGSVKRIPKNHRGIPLVGENPERNSGRKVGQRYKSRGSGLVVVWPFVGSVESISMQKQPEELINIDVVCKDGKFAADATMVWHVKQEAKDNPSAEIEPATRVPSRLSKEHLLPAFYGTHARMLARYLDMPHIIPSVSEDDENLYRALFEIQKDKLDNYVKSVAKGGIVATAKDLRSVDLLTPDVALPKTRELFGARLDACGVIVDEIFVTSLGPSENQVQADALREIWGTKAPGDDGTGGSNGPHTGNGTSPPQELPTGV